jgi:hypothetical protein
METHEDYLPAEPSERALAAAHLEATVAAMGLGNGSGLRRSTDGRCYIVGTKYGTVLVYSVEYVAVMLSCKIEGLPREDRRVYGSAADAAAFLRLAFAENKPDEAMRVPLRQPKRKNPPAQSPLPNATQAGYPDSFPEDFLGGGE